MPGKYTKTVFNKTRPFWYSASLQRSFYDNRKLPDVTDLEYWDSTLEFRTYQELLKYFSADRITRQHEIIIFPENPPFKKWSWKVDFCIRSKKLFFPLYVESKGGWIKHDKGNEREFIHMLRVLHELYPSVFNNLLLVSDSNWHLSNTSIKPIKIKDLALYIQKKWRV